MEPYPLSNRAKIIERYEAGEETAEIAERYGYSESGVRRVRQRQRESGSYAPKAGKVGRKPALDEAARQRLSEAVKRKPDATLAELREAVGVQADLAVYCRVLKRLGLSRKKSRSAPPNRTART